MSKHLNLTLHVWRQKNTNCDGKFVEYPAENVSPDMSFLEMLDVVNEGLIRKGEDPITFDHDCREGICGTCSMVINGRPHGPKERTTTCQLHMRSFQDGESITLEPWRAEAFPVLRDLMVDRTAFDRIIAAGGFISVPTGSPQDANALPIPKVNAELAMDAAACIGCGACAAACPNSSPMLFVGAKVTHLGLLPQGQAERKSRARNMVRTMQEEGFGNCSNYYACEAVCPANVPASVIAMLNREYIRGEVSESVGAID